MAENDLAVDHDHDVGDYMEVYAPAYGEDQGEEQPSEPPRFRIYSSSELDQLDCRVEYLIEDVLPCDQFGTIIAIDKCLKTHTAAELAVSVATGTQCFEHFSVPEARRTLVMTGESGPASTQNMARRIARAHGYQLSNIPNLFWSNDIPNATRADDLIGLDEIIKGRGTKLAILDPGYLMTPGVQAGQITEMGAVLRGFIEICTQNNCTVVAVVHAKKPNYGGANQRFRYSKPERTDVSGSGWAEASRFWILLKPRAEMVLGSREDGTERQWRNWFCVGGSAEHAGTYGLDVNEGIHDRERGGMTKWETTIRKECEIVRERIEEQKSDQADKDAALERAIRIVLTETYSSKVGPTKTSICKQAAKHLDQISINKDRFDRVFNDMIDTGDVVVEPNEEAKHPTYKLSEDPNEA